LGGTYGAATDVPRHGVMTEVTKTMFDFVGAAAAFRGRALQRRIYEGRDIQNETFAARAGFTDFVSAMRAKYPPL